MESVGIRELRANLSRWVRRVEEGEEVVVTDRGKPVARLVPAIGDRIYDDLIRRGVIIPAEKEWSGPLPEPIPLEGEGPSFSEMVIGDRR